MPMWRCPFCGAAQPESARCWVCNRSSVSCGTCLHFRGSVAAGLGYCGLDRRRLPLTGSEIRGCWEERRLPVIAAPHRPASSPDPDARPRLDFVPISDGDAPPVPGPGLPGTPGGAGDPGFGLWAEGEG